MLWVERAVVPADMDHLIAATLPVMGSRFRNGQAAMPKCVSEFLK